MPPALRLYSAPAKANDDDAVNNIFRADACFVVTLAVNTFSCAGVAECVRGARDERNSSVDDYGQAQARPQKTRISAALHDFKLHEARSLWKKQGFV
jgi:hypothetical protein